MIPHSLFARFTVDLPTVVNRAMGQWERNRMEILCPKILGGKKGGPVSRIQSITGNSSDAVRLYSDTCKAHVIAKSEYR